MFYVHVEIVEYDWWIKTRKKNIYFFRNKNSYLLNFFQINVTLKRLLIQFQIQVKCRIYFKKQTSKTFSKTFLKKKIKCFILFRDILDQIFNSGNLVNAKIEMVDLIESWCRTENLFGQQSHRCTHGERRGRGNKTGPPIENFSIFLTKSLKTKQRVGTPWYIFLQPQGSPMQYLPNTFTNLLPCIFNY